MLYYFTILFIKEIFVKGGVYPMNNSDLIWHLVELILQKEKDLNQVALDQAKINNKPNEHKQDEA